MAEFLISILRREKNWNNLSFSEQHSLEQSIRMMKPVDNPVAGQFISMMDDGSKLFIDTLLPDRICLRATNGFDLFVSHPLYENFTASIRCCELDKAESSHGTTVPAVASSFCPSQLPDLLKEIFSGGRIPASLLNGLYRLPPVEQIARFNRRESSILRYFFYIMGEYFCITLKRADASKPVILRMIQTDRFGRRITAETSARVLPADFRINEQAEQQLLTMPRPLGVFCVGPRSRGESGAISNFNGTVLFTDDGEQEIVCRHLALQYAMDVIANDKGKVDLRQHYSTEKAIASHIFSDKEAECMALRRAYTGKVINSDHFGRLVKQLLEVMESNGITHKSFMICTIDHALAVRLVIRTDEGEMKRYVVSVYDPNSTGMAISSRVLSPEQFLTADHSLGAYNLDQNYACELLYEHPVIIMPTDRMSLPPCPFPSLSLDSLHFCLTAGDETFLQHVHDEIIQKDNVAELLNCRMNSTSGLLMALFNQHHRIVTQFINILQKSLMVNHLSCTQVLEILRAPTGNGIPGLFIVLYLGFDKVFTAYINGLESLVITGFLSHENLINLLEARTQDDFPGFYAALQQGHSVTVTAFISGLESLAVCGHLNTLQVFTLLSAKLRDGTSGLNAALRNGHHETVEAFISGVEKLVAGGYLSREQVGNLLHALRKDGTPGLFLALKTGSYKSVEVFIAGIERLIAKGYLSRAQGYRLLRAERRDGTSGFTVAQKSNDYKVIMTYSVSIHRIIARGHLSWEQGDSLLR